MEGSDKYLELLELPPEATPDDIRRRYRYLKKLYSEDSIEIRALNSDFPQEIRDDYLSRLDEAYEKLSEQSEKSKPALKLDSASISDELRAWIAQIDCFTGANLKAVRERMQVDLAAIFAVTRIQPHFLEDMENEVFQSFRAEVYLRSYLIEYTRFLLLDTTKVLNDYLPRYRAWLAQHKPV